MRVLRRLPVLLLPLLATSIQAQRGPLRGFDAYVEEAMRDWQVPGMAIAIVKDDSVVYARGFGVRELGRPDPVDEHTSFAIASTTKAFTATAIAMLVDEGRLRWDDPVARHLPGFELRDPHGTGGITVRDLLTHRTGIPGADYLWYAADNSRDDILHRMRFLRPGAPPRTRYQYNNNAYAIAGLVVQAVAGMSWEEFIQRRILEPLGMRETLTGHGGLDQRGNVATPHDFVDDSLRAIPYRVFDNIAPAGAMNSSVHDMARWIRFQLDSARVDGRRLVSEAARREMLTPQFLVPAADFYPAARLANPHFTAYGLGWFLQDYRGRTLAMHTGSIDGMSAIVALVPEERLGFVIFANLDHAEVRHALMYRIVDAFLGGPQRDWSRDLRPVYPPVLDRIRAARQQRESRRVPDTRPSLALEAYAGTFADPDSLYRPLEVVFADGRLTARIGSGFAGELEHWHYDVFRVRWTDRTLGNGFLTFTIDPEGTARWVRVEAGGMVQLTRVGEPPAVP